VLKSSLVIFKFSAVGGNVSRWETTLSELEEALIEKQAKEKETKQDVDRLVDLNEKMKKEIGKLKEEIEAKEEEIGKCRRDVGSCAKEIQQAQKVMGQLENRRDQKKSERHTVLTQCKVIS
jgi:structural maintenance of chromosome 1